MPRKTGVPSYLYYKPRDCARVRIDGRDHYLGEFGSVESKAEYARLIADWQRTGSVEVEAAAAHLTNRRHSQ